MRTGRLIFSAIQFLITAALFGTGAVFLGLHYMPHVRAELAEWIIYPNLSFFFLGCLVLGTAVLLTICFWMTQRTQYIRMEMKGQPFSIDQAVVKQAIGQFWRQEFPQVVPPTEIYFSREKVEVITQSIGCNLEEIELKLGAFLYEQLGYEKDFFVTFTVK